jgi:hypothetical protein
MGLDLGSVGSRTLSGCLGQRLLVHVWGSRIMVSMIVLYPLQFIVRSTNATGLLS